MEIITYLLIVGLGLICLSLNKNVRELQKHRIWAEGQIDYLSTIIRQARERNEING